MEKYGIRLKINGIELKDINKQRITTKTLTQGYETKQEDPTKQWNEKEQSKS